jgi:hypothetical protein
VRVSPRRAAAAALVLPLLALLVEPPAAGGQEPPPSSSALPDATPTAWHEAAGLTPLLTLPPPPNPATICIIDTGVTPTPDLTITARWAYDGGTLDDVRATDDSPGHGTLVAHFAAAAVNGWGGAGAFPHARITSVRVFPREGGARWQDYIRAVTRCPKLDPNTKVIVIAIGGQEISPDEAAELEHHIDQARDLYDMNVVAAAGNSTGRPDFPARFTSSFAVAGLTAKRTPCDFSARGPEVDIGAPGCGLAQSGWNGSPWSSDGTSFAAPIVAGSLAALRSYTPALNARDAEALLIRSAVRAEVPAIDAAAALRAAGIVIEHREIAPAVHSDTSSPPVVEAPPAMVPRAPSRASVWRPVLTARHSGKRVRIRASNRPAGAILELRLARTVVRRRRSVIVLRTKSRRARGRFVTEWGTSGYATVRW